MKKSPEILVVGGGVTGCGVLFDLAQRGFRCLLVERGPLAGGTSGRFHGLLHSGGRYVVKDLAAARECFAENRILRRVMPHCIEETGGLFIALPDDPPDYPDQFYRACLAAGLAVQELSPGEALRREPLLNPRLARAFELPDASVETWQACQSLRDAAAEYGAETLLYHQVAALITHSGKLVGAQVNNLRTGETLTLECDLLVNAAGAWSGQIAGMAGCDVTIKASKGTMIALNYRLVNSVINRCHPPGDGDILVPVGTVAVIGTTSVSVPDPDHYSIEAWEIQRLLDEGEQLVPGLKKSRALRAWAGVRPLYQEQGAGPDLRRVSRSHALLDHATRDGVENLVTITGGKWTTYRLMAEEAADLVCRKLGTDRPGRTATTPLLPHQARKFFTVGRRLTHLEANEQLICECELVTRPPIEARLAQGDTTLDDLRRDLRLGMGPCQGTFCAYRATGMMMEEAGQLPAGAVNRALADFLEERWKGLKPVLWGAQLRQVGLEQGIYLGLLGLDKLRGGGEQKP